MFDCKKDTICLLERGLTIVCRASSNLTGPSKNSCWEICLKVLKQYLLELIHKICAKSNHFQSEHWLTSWKPKLLPLAGAAGAIADLACLWRNCKLPDILLCVGSQASGGRRDGWSSLEVYTDMFDSCLFIYVWQVVSWHVLACLVYENASSGALQCVCDVWARAVAVTSFWPCFRSYAAMFDSCVFIYVLTGGILTWFGTFMSCQVIHWHVFSCWNRHVLCCHVWFMFIHIWLTGVLLTWVAGKRWKAFSTKKVLRVSLFWNVMVGITSK